MLAFFKQIDALIRAVKSFNFYASSRALDRPDNSPESSAELERSLAESLIDRKTRFAVPIKIRAAGGNWRGSRQRLANRLTRLPYTRFSSRLVDRLLISTKGGQQP